MPALGSAAFLSISAAILYRESYPWGACSMQWYSGYVCCRTSAQGQRYLLYVAQTWTWGQS